MGMGDMRLRHMEGLDGVTKSMRVGDWTGPEASRGPFDRARTTETSLVTQTSELLGRTPIKNPLHHDRSLEGANQGSVHVEEPHAEEPHT